VSVQALDAFLSQLSAGPAAHRAQQAAAQQQLLLSALEQQSGAAARQERALAAQRRKLLQQVCCDSWLLQLCSHILRDYPACTKPVHEMQCSAAGAHIVWLLILLLCPYPAGAPAV
jgi:hypothetical protein